LGITTMLVATCYNLGGEKTLMRLDEGSIVARAAGRQLESLNGKREILVVGVVHQEPVVERFLDTVGVIAGWNKRTWGARG